MTLYLHNCTQRTLEVCYRTNFTSEGRDATQRERQGFHRRTLKPWDRGHIDVPAGADASHIIGQLQRAGGIATTDPLPRRTTVAFLYDPVKPVTLAKRDDVVKHNRLIKTEEGAQRRRNAAIGTDDLLIKNLTNRGLPATLRPPETTVEYEQIEESEQDDRGRTTEGFHVKPDAPREPGGRKGSKGKQTRAAA